MKQPAGTVRDAFAGPGGTTAQPQLLCTASGGYFNSLNAEWERVLGWTREELTSRPITDFVHPLDRQVSRHEAAKAAWPGFELTNFENRFRSRGGVWHWLRWTARADGSTWVAAAIDITEEKQAEALERLAPGATLDGPTAAVQPSVALELEALAAPRAAIGEPPPVAIRTASR